MKNCHINSKKNELPRYPLKQKDEVGSSTSSEGFQKKSQKIFLEIYMSCGGSS